MRTAKDIVKDYRKRGYDNFRLRAIAALRPEPMRSQIMQILSKEDDFTEAELITTSSENLTTPSGIMRVVTESDYAQTPVEAKIDSHSNEIDSSKTATEELTVITELELNEQKLTEAITEEQLTQQQNDISETNLDEVEDKEEGKIEELTEAETINPETEKFDAEEIVVEKIEPAVTEASVGEVQLAIVGEDEQEIELSQAKTANENSQETVPISQIDEISDFWDEESIELSEEEKFESVMSETKNESAATAAILHNEAAAELQGQWDAVENSATDNDYRNSEEKQILTQDVLDTHADTVEDYEQQTLAEKDSRHQDKIPEETNTEVKEELEELLQESEEEDTEVEDADLSETESHSDSSHLHLVNNNEIKAEQEDTAEFDNDEHIIYLFDNIDKNNTEEIAEFQATLVDCETPGTEWHDYGSGLIQFPEEMHQIHLAYTEALNQPVPSTEETEEEEVASETKQEPEEVSKQFTLDELIDSIEQNNTLPEKCDFDAVIDEIGEIENSAQQIDSDNTEKEEPCEVQTTANESYLPEITPEPETNTDSRQEEKESSDYSTLSSEISELEELLNNLENNLAKKQNKITEITALLAEKDEMIKLQAAQINETRSQVSQKDAAIFEMQATTSHLHEMTRELLNLRLENEELERERNISKTETVPALEEQQLNLVEMVEDEMQAHAQTRKLYRKSSRRTAVSFALAVAATICLVLVPTLNYLAARATPELNPANKKSAQLQLAEGDLRTTINTQTAELQQLTQEKLALHAAYREKESRWKEKEGHLMRQIKDSEHQLVLRTRSLAEQLNAAQKNMQNQVRLASLSNKNSISHRAMAAGSYAKSRSNKVRFINRKYRVKTGDTLTSIVKRYYGRTDSGRLVTKVAQKNGLRNANDIYINQVITLAAIPEE